MNKVINIDSGTELYKLFLQKSKNNLNSLSETTLNVTPRAAEEYNKLCKALESYGRSLLIENNPQYKQLIDTNLQVYDMIKSAESERNRSLINGAIDNARKNGKPFEFIYEGARYVAEIIDGKPNIKFLDVIKK